MRLTVGSATLPRNFQKVLTCISLTWSCHLLLPSPPWERWLQVTAKSLAGPHVLVAFRAVAALTGGLCAEGGCAWLCPRRTPSSPQLSPVLRQPAGRGP